MSEPTHVCPRNAWPTGHPLPPEDTAKLTGPLEGELVIFTSRYSGSVVARVIARSYVWSPGECRHKGGYRRYDWTVIQDRANGGRIVVDDKDLTTIEVGLKLELTPEGVTHE